MRTATPETLGLKEYELTYKRLGALAAMSRVQPELSQYVLEAGLYVKSDLLGVPADAGRVMKQMIALATDEGWNRFVAPEGCVHRVEYLNRTGLHRFRATEIKVAGTYLLAVRDAEEESHRGHQIIGPEARVDLVELPGFDGARILASGQPMIDALYGHTENY